MYKLFELQIIDFSQFEEISNYRDLCNFYSLSKKNYSNLVSWISCLLIVFPDYVSTKNGCEKKGLGSMK